MRVDDLVSSIASRLYADEQSPTLKGRHFSDSPARSFADQLEISDIDTDSLEVSAGTPSETATTASAPVSRNSSSTAASLRSDGMRGTLRCESPEGDTVVSEPSVQDTRSSTAQSSATEPRAPASTPGTVVQSKAEEVYSPFGKIQLGSSGPSFVTGDPLMIDVKADSELEAFFMTSQPADWMYRTEAREDFEQLYGKAALVTLDLDGTVPENVNPMWVTRRAVDANGRPITKTPAITSNMTSTERA